MAAGARESMAVFDGPKGLSAAFAGPHAWCNEKMMLSENLSDGISLPEFFASGAFDRALSLYAETSGGTDRRAVASMWSLYYFSALTIPYVVARVLDHQALPAAFDGMTVALSADGLPRAFGVATTGEWRDDDASDVFTLIGSLMDDHLARVVPHLKATGGISPRLAWNNAAVYIDYALRTAGTDPMSDQADAMVACRLMPNGGANPFFDCLRQEEEDGAPVCRRKICCLRYLLPGIPSCGSLCALPSQRKQ
ncbi:siderophore-iron reductase FhuF [Sinorhizobium medicae]|uniref:Ferric iron reductase n=2 Tax=Sinorhizobium medicae TaxID=110321 RepID=A0A508WUS2_9HYPH|nr:siderophore-iron reductase FhuF [Sinorhizobium medicae]MDX0522487.1 siderophore-iron reductase FhuF [Sinorhizobium medicae]MDX0546642.1 siderophore-iron reductase FhuF [Sinorhizobium medicae]MDX0632348.1 siderophore-iron reductase FhuF [Sinorhizobium medicae]MDX0714144.1 siderophore-iron reductase FhuF [Sinorhizobium medicae]